MIQLAEGSLRIFHNLFDNQVGIATFDNQDIPRKMAGAGKKKKSVRKKKKSSRVKPPAPPHQLQTQFMQEQVKDLSSQMTSLISENQDLRSDLRLTSLNQDDIIEALDTRCTKYQSYVDQIQADHQHTQAQRDEIQMALSKEITELRKADADARALAVRFTALEVRHDESSRTLEEAQHRNKTLAAQNRVLAGQLEESQRELRVIERHRSRVALGEVDLAQLAQLALPSSSLVFVLLHALERGHALSNSNPGFMTEFCIALQALMSASRSPETIVAAVKTFRGLDLILQSMLEARRGTETTRLHVYGTKCIWRFVYHQEDGGKDVIPHERIIHVMVHVLSGLNASDASDDHVHHPDLDDRVLSSCCQILKLVLPHDLPNSTESCFDERPHSSQMPREVWRTFQLLFRLVSYLGKTTNPTMSQAPILQCIHTVLERHGRFAPDLLLDSPRVRDTLVRVWTSEQSTLDSKQLGMTLFLTICRAAQEKSEHESPPTCLSALSQEITPDVLPDALVSVAEKYFLHDSVFLQGLVETFRIFGIPIKSQVRRWIEHVGVNIDVDQSNNFSGQNQGSSLYPNTTRLIRQSSQHQEFQNSKNSKNSREIEVQAQPPLTLPRIV